MHAVAISKVECREPADRFAATCALPMRRALPVLHMPVVFNFAPSEPRCFADGMMKGAPISHCLLMSGEAARLLARSGADSKVGCCAVAPLRRGLIPPPRPLVQYLISMRCP